MVDEGLLPLLEIPMDRHHMNVVATNLLTEIVTEVPIVIVGRCLPWVAHLTTGALPRQLNIHRLVQDPITVEGLHHLVQWATHSKN